MAATMNISTEHRVWNFTEMSQLQDQRNLSSCHGKSLWAERELKWSDVERPQVADVKLPLSQVIQCHGSRSLAITHKLLVISASLAEYKDTRANTASDEVAIKWWLKIPVTTFQMLNSLHHHVKYWCQCPNTQFFLGKLGFWNVLGSLMIFLLWLDVPVKEFWELLIFDKDKIIPTNSLTKMMNSMVNRSNTIFMAISILCQAVT